MAVIVPVASKFDDSGIKKAKSAFSGLASSLKGTIGALGLATSVVGLTKALSDASKAAISDTKSQALLANQLKNSVGANDAVIASSEQFIKSLMLQTSIADDELRPALSRLVLATGSVDQAQKLLSLSTDIAAGTGKDLSAVSIAVGKAAAGQTTALFRLIPSLKGSSDWASAAATQFDGMAIAAANNDPYQRLNVIFGEMSETVGMALLPYLQDIADYFASPQGQKNINDFATSVTDALKAIGDLGKGLSDLAPIADPVFGFLNGLIAAFTGNTQRAAEIFYNLFSWIPGAKKPKSLTIAPVIKAPTMPTLSGTSSFGTTSKGTTASTKKTAAQIAADKAKAAYDKAVADLKNFQADLKGMSDFSGLTSMTKVMGEFEQSVVNTFADISKKIAEGLANKTISSKGVAALKATLASYNALLIENAKQRDAIIAKRSLAEALINDVKSALTGTGNLASLLDTQTKQVTTSITKIVNGFTVTTKQTVDEVIGSKGVVGRLKDVVAKTKAFANQLKDLKAAGLSPDLFKQIVDAGPDVGGQLATEILAGGADSVTALNDTFKELETVSAQVAEQTAVVMYNNGVEVAGGLVNGLLSQEQALVDAAKTLADAFNAAYQAQVMQLIPTVAAPKVAPKTAPKSTTVVVNNTIRASQNTKADAAKIVAAVNKYATASGYGLLNAKLL